MFAEPMPLDRKFLDISQGLAKTFSRKIFDSNGYAVTGFTGRETFEIDIWQGDTGKAIHNVEATGQWVRPMEGEYQIAIGASDIPKGVYSIRSILLPNGETCYDGPREVYRGFLRVSPSPSDSICDPLKSYCTYQDLLERAPWVETTHVDQDLNGFARHRHRARAWIDEAIIRNAPNSNWNASNVVFYGLYPPGYSTSGRVRYMLDKNELVVTPQIRDCAAHYSLYLICDALSSTPSTGSYAEIAKKHYYKAQTQLQSMNVAFSEDGTTVNYSLSMQKLNGRSLF